MSIQLDSDLKGLGQPKIQSALKRAFGIETVEDLLKHYPRRYLKRGELSLISALPLGEQVTIVAEVRSVTNRTMRQRKGSILEVVISDGEGILTLTFFNQPWRLTTEGEGGIRVGDRGLFSGKISRFKDKIQLAHPTFVIFDQSKDEQEHQTKTGKTLDPEVWATQPVPIYPATGSLSSDQIAKVISQVLSELGDVPEVLPEAVRQEHKLLSYGQALRLIHEPVKDSEYRQARRTLAFIEGFVLQLSLLKHKLELRAQHSLERISTEFGLRDAFEQTLPFELTADQLTVSQEISADLAQPYPMNRLLHGEVGSGKTLVALLAMITVAESGGQSGLLVPTEVLAIQHYRSIVKLLGPELTERLQPVLLTGQLTVGERRKALLAIASGTAQIVVGTHALFAEKTQFYDLGLVVIDEQHRFGVDQRELLRAKGNNPNMLFLSATPIPRTVAMTIFGDLDISTIQTMPARRAGIDSHVVSLVQNPAWAERIWERLVEELEAGHQVFVVTPAINIPEEGKDPIVEPDAELAEWLEEDSGTKIATIEETSAFLADYAPLDPYKIGVLHGQMPSDEKDVVMSAFAANELQVLVATTVIEVGVDVPNATMMIVLSADRFGVSQLHQLRGRIGRGELPGLALFVTEAPPESLAMERIAAVASTTDGFELAQMDLELRREGDVLGSRQSGGRSTLKLLRVTRDTELILQARVAAEAVLREDAALKQHPEIARVLAQLNQETAEYLQKS